MWSDACRRRRLSSDTRPFRITGSSGSHSDCSRATCFSVSKNFMSTLHSQPEKTTACVLLCARSSRWTTAIREHLKRSADGSWAATVCHSTSLSECDRQLAHWPASLVAWEVDVETLGSSLSWLAGWETKYPWAAAIALSNGMPEECRWALREAGASLVVTSPRHLTGVTGLAARHFEQTPRRSLGWRQRMLETLPWSEAAPHLVYPPNHTPLSGSV